MAKAKLTERQQEIVDLLETGKTPTEIGKKLKISTNGVYQQMRRIRKLPGYKTIGNTANGGTSSGGSTAAKRSSTGRQSARTAQRASRPAPRPAPAAKPQSAHEILTAEVEDVKAQITAEQEVVTQAEASIVAAKANIEALTVELARREDTLAVLTGDKVAHAKPAPKPAPAAPKANGSGRKTAAQKVAEQDAAKRAAAAAEAEGAQEAAPASADPFPGDGGAPEADAAQAAAEAPQEAPAAA